ncbi:MAG: IS701 family transposase [bacterium]|nr:IS701 family transposase [bacterium]
MDQELIESEARFEAYVESLSEVIGHADRVEPLEDYCSGLLLPLERKSVEPLAAAVAPDRVSAKHQSLLHFVAQSPWSDDRVLTKVQDLVLPSIERGGPIKTWIVDDTGLPKKGKHSVGVARQYCGQLGKQDNCQVAVSLSVANDVASLPIAYRLYLPKTWAHDAERRGKAGVPADVVFKTKPEIALEQITAAHDAGVARGVVLADAAYGNDTKFRTAVSALGLEYMMGVLGSISLWPPGQEPLAPKPKTGRGRPGARLRRDQEHQPVSAKELAMGLKPRAWKTITWRDGTNAPLAGRFAAVRVRPAHRDQKLSEPRPREWLLIEWPKGEAEPTKYWLSTLPGTTKLADLVAMAKQRWRIERDYQDLKQEVGLGHYEGRGWRGFHHHATLCIAAYGFLISERETIPPSGPGRRAKRKALGVPKDYRPRGSADPSGAARRKFNCHSQAAPRRPARENSTEVPMLWQGPE